MALFDNVNPEEFLLFVRNFKMALEALGTLAASAKLQYLRMILCGEELRQFDIFCYYVVSKNTTHLNHIILGLGIYSTPVNTLSKKSARCATE